MVVDVIFRVERHGARHAAERRPGEDAAKGMPRQPNGGVIGVNYVALRGSHRPRTNQNKHYHQASKHLRISFRGAGSKRVTPGIYSALLTLFQPERDNRTW